MLMRLRFVGLGLPLALLFASTGDFRVVSGQLVAAQAENGKLKFEIYQDAAKEFRWRLKAGNGAILATAGQGYKSKASCQEGVSRIKANAASSRLTFEVYEDKAKEHRWRLKSSNGQIVASSSEGYKAKSDCQHAIDLIKKGARQAQVEEEK